MLYQTLSHTLKLAPHESPSRRTLNNYAIFYAKPSRKTLNNFGKPSTTLIIHIFLQFSFKKCHCFLSRHEKNRFLTKCCPICRTSIVYFHFYFLLPNDLLQFWHLHTQKQVHEQEAYAINVPFSVFVFFPNFIWNSSYLNIIFASCIYYSPILDANTV